jgi:hypothetical protein
VTVLDAQGNPLPGSGAVPDLLDQLVGFFDADPSTWIKLEGRFNELTALLEPRAAELHGVVSGQAFIDSSIDAGKVLGRMLADVVMMVLLMKRKDDREKARTVDQAAENGAVPALKVLPKEDDGVNAPQA